MNADSDAMKRRVIDVAVVIVEAARFPGLGQHSGVDILDTLPGEKAVAHSHILSRDGIASADITRELIVADGALLCHMDRVPVGARTSRHAERSQGVVLERGNTMQRTLLVQEMEQQLGTTLPRDYADGFSPRVTGAGIALGERRVPAASLSLGFVRFNRDADECLPGAIADVSPAVAGLSGVTGGTAPSLDLRMHRPVPGNIGTCSIRDRRWALEQPALSKANGEGGCAGKKSSKKYSHARSPFERKVRRKWRIIGMPAMANATRLVEANAGLFSGHERKGGCDVVIHGIGTRRLVQGSPRQHSIILHFT